MSELRARSLAPLKKTRGIGRTPGKETAPRPPNRL